MHAPFEITVRHVMTADPVVVLPDCPVQDVLRVMNRLRIGAAIVGVDGCIHGIFTERDFLRQTAEASPGWRDKPVGEWMTREPHTIEPDCGWEDAVTRMEEWHVRHLPVIERGRIVGIVSARQLIARRNEHLNRMVEERTDELQRLYDEVSARDSELRQNMVIAGRLQTRLMLPNASPGWPEVRWGIHYAPLDPLGGDYYDFAVSGERHMGLLIADASGHSIAAGMVAIMARFAFAEVVRKTIRPAEVLGSMNRRLQGLTDERFVTAFYGVLDRETREFRYASAGHPPALRYSPRDRRVEELPARGLMLGIMPEAIYEESSVTLEPGDRLCLYTDGVIESRNVAKEAFGIERLKRFLLESNGTPAEELTKDLVRRLEDFRSDLPAWDDLTILIAEVAGVPPPGRGGGPPWGSSMGSPGRSGGGGPGGRPL
jgi:sigma-B regulation protein RsbU (phosphoserine phosphatase)